LGDKSKLQTNIFYKKGDIFQSKVQTLVNTINCKGVMGAGLAKKFKQKFPEMFEDYKKRCTKKKVIVGQPYVWKNPDPEGHWVLNFPTKDSWNKPSKLEWIIEGLEYFIKNYRKWQIKSIAFPALGCNLGGLSWLDVKPALEKYLSKVNIPVEIYIPKLTLTEEVMVFLLKNLHQHYKESIQSISIIRELYPSSDEWTDWKRTNNLKIMVVFADKVDIFQLAEIEKRIFTKYNIHVSIISTTTKDFSKYKGGTLKQKHSRQNSILEYLTTKHE